MDHAIQKAVREAVKDFDHTSDYYFLIFNNLTKTFDSTTSTSTSTTSQQQSPQPSSAEETTDSSDKEYLDYLLFDSGDGVIVRIERRSPSPSTLKIKNCDQITDSTQKIFNYDLNLKISSTSSSNWEDDFNTTKNCSTSSSMVATSTPISTATTTPPIPGIAITAPTTASIKKLKKSTSLLTDNTSNNSYNHNEPMRQLQNTNTFCNSSDSWVTMMMDDVKGIDNHHSKVQQNNVIDGISGNSSSNNNNSNNSSINGHHGTDSDDDNIIFDSSSEKPWICKNCNRGYKWRNSLTCHQKNECGKPPKYYCTKLCGYRTNIRSNLRRHLNTKCSSKHRITSPPSSTEPLLTKTVSHNHSYIQYKATKNLDGNNGNGKGMTMNRLNKTLS